MDRSSQEHRAEKEFKEDINESVDLMKEQYTQLAEMYYQVTFEEFLEQSGITEDQFVEKMEKQAKDQLKSKYASKLIAEKEKLELSDKAYKEKYDEYAQPTDTKTEMHLLRQMVRTEKRS